MKKLSLLFTLALSLLGGQAMAQDSETSYLITPSNTSVYTIKVYLDGLNNNKTDGGYLSYDPDCTVNGTNVGGTYLVNTRLTYATSGLAEENKYFAIITSEHNNYYLFSPKANKFIYSTTGVNGAMMRDVPNQTMTLTDNSTNNTTHPYLLALNNGTNQLNFNNQGSFDNIGGVLTTWNSATDIGNQLQITEAATGQDLTVAVARANLYEAIAIAQAKYDATNFGTTFGTYVHKDELYAEIQTATTALNNMENTADQLVSAKEELNADVAAVVPNYPVDGDFIRIKGHNTNTTYLAGTNSESNTSRAAFTAVSGNETATVFYYHNGYIYNLSNGYPLAATSDANPFAYFNGITEGTKITFAENTVCSTSGAGLYNIKFYDSKRYLHADDADYSNAGGSASSSDDNYTFDLEKVTTLPITITSAGYATLNLPVAVKIPEGITVYYVAEKDENSVAISDQASLEVLPANSPVLIAGTAGVHNFEIVSDNTDAALTETGLKGLIEAKNVTDAGAYLLANKSKGVGFYPLNTAKPGVRGFRGYYAPANTTSNGFALTFGDTTGIDAAIADAIDAAAPVFDLSGRQVTKTVKGRLYIQNGKKFVK